MKKTITNIKSYQKASKVYLLYNKPENLSILVNGDGHGTLPYVRRMICVLKKVVGGEYYE